MVANENVSDGAALACGGHVVGHPFPVALHHRGLGLQHDEVWRAFGKTALELVRRPLLGDAV